MGIVFAGNSECFKVLLDGTPILSVAESNGKRMLIETRISQH